MIDIKVPEAGESITQVELARWLAEDGEYVEKDQEIAEIDSDKATLALNAEAAGILKIIIEEGSTVEPGKVIGQIDTAAEKPKSDTEGESPEANQSEASDTSKNEPDRAQQEPQDNTGRSATPKDSEKNKTLQESSPKKTDAEYTFSPQAKKMLDDMDISLEDIIRNPQQKRITRKDILVAIASSAGTSSKIETAPAMEEDSFYSQKDQREVQKTKMTTLRKKIAERLVAVKNDTAMLTTFNEVDMSAIMKLRNQYKDRFQEKFGIKPGFMSFFAKAVTLSIPMFPQVNGQIQDDHILIPRYADIGIAVSTPKGLMVPIIRNAQSKSLFELEKEIARLAQKARDNKITIEELTGGTFSITNGGVFGSMLSTPIINPPQSAILGMHNIVERPVAINGKVEIRPVMYVALSYDHRVIDGKESVGFLVKIKEFLENPVSMLFPNRKAEEVLLGL